MPLDTYFTTIGEIGAGATVTEGLFSQPSGVEGISFTASATALGDGGLTEATLRANHDFIFRLTVDPGQTVEMAFGFTQGNFVEYTPEAFTPPSVPLPAAAWMLVGSLAALGFTGRRRALPLRHGRRDLSPTATVLPSST